jgi:glucokinase
VNSSRQLTPLSQAKPPFFLGVDLGGTNVKIGLVDDEGQILAHQSMPTQVPEGPEEGARRMGQRAVEIVCELGIPLKDIPFIGLATPGTMDIPAGMLLEPHNLPGWFHFPIRDRLSHHAGKPVVFANDAAAACWGEFWRGSGSEFHSMILLTLGTGVGGGIIVDHQLIEGEHSHGAECGHIIIDYGDDARICACGRGGHLEAYASGTALVKRTQEALDAGRASSLAERLERGEELTPLIVAEEASGGDELCSEIILDTARYLGVGIVSLMHTIDPNGVVLGGAMTFGGHQTELGRRFLRRVKQEVCERTFPVLAERVEIDFASLGGDAGFIGAAGIARAEHRKQDIRL